jgi:hypothetical protein
VDAIQRFETLGGVDVAAAPSRVDDAAGFRRHPRMIGQQHDLARRGREHAVIANVARRGARERDPSARARDVPAFERKRLAFEVLGRRWYPHPDAVDEEANVARADGVAIHRRETLELERLERRSVGPVRDQHPLAVDRTEAAAEECVAGGDAADADDRTVHAAVLADLSAAHGAQEHLAADDAPRRPGAIEHDAAGSGELRRDALDHTAVTRST